MTELTLEFGDVWKRQISEFREASTDNGVEEIIYFEGSWVRIDPDQAWFWTREWQAGERRVDEYIRSGDFESFDTMDEFIDSLGD